MKTVFLVFIVFFVCVDRRLHSACSVPMQHVLRYPLLLKELLKHTPSDDARRDGALSALTSLKDVAKHIDVCKHDTENYGLFLGCY